MLQENELDRALTLWGPIGMPISKKLIKLWGRIDSESVISLYRMVSKGLVVTSSMPLRHRNRNRDR